MKRYTIKYTKEAQLDADKIGDYIAFELSEPAIAIQILEKIAEKCKKLSIFPKGAPIREKIGKTNFRFIHSGNYTIVYSVNDEKLEVIIRAIIYSGRDISKILEESK